MRTTVTTQAARVLAGGAACAVAISVAGVAPARASTAWHSPAAWAASAREWVPADVIGNGGGSGPGDRVREWNDSEPESGTYVQVVVTRVSSATQSDRSWASNALNRDYYGGPDPTTCPVPALDGDSATCSDTGGWGVPYTLPHGARGITGYMTRAMARRGLYLVEVQEFSTVRRRDAVSPAQLGAYAAFLAANPPAGIPITDLPGDTPAVAQPGSGGAQLSKMVASRLTDAADHIQALSRTKHRAYRKLLLSKKPLASTGLPSRTMAGLLFAGFGNNNARNVFLRYSSSGKARCARANARVVGASFTVVRCPVTSWRPVT